MTVSRRYRRIITICVSCAAVFFLTHHIYSGQAGGSERRRPVSNVYSPRRPKTAPREEKELVVASLAGDDVSWLDEFFDTWVKNVYVVNNASAALTVAVNKGREAMPFLTYGNPTSLKFAISGLRKRFIDAIVAT